MNIKIKFPSPPPPATTKKRRKRRRNGKKNDIFRGKFRTPSIHLGDSIERAANPPLHTPQFVTSAKRNKKKEKKNPKKKEPNHSRTGTFRTSRNLLEDCTAKLEPLRTNHERNNDANETNDDRFAPPPPLREEVITSV